MLFDTVEFLSPQSKIVNPVIEVNESASNPTEAAVTKQYVDDGLATKADASALTAKANASDVTTALALKADVATTYTKTEVDAKVGTAAAQIYDSGGFSQGKPDASSSLFRLVAPRAFSLPQNLTGSIAKAGTAATASTVFAIKKNGTQIGTMTFAASGSTASFSFASAVSVAIGDIIDMVAPATQDATLSDISVTLVATLA